jgi:predicted membrane protein
MDNIEYTRQHRDKENKNKTGCPFMIVADLVFCVLFLFCLSPCCVLCTQCCSFMIADLVFCVLFLFSLSLCCVLCTQWSATIMNGQHWVHKTQRGDKQNKNKTQKTKSAIMNEQHWVHNRQHCCRFCFLCFIFIFFVSVLFPVYSMFSIHDCCRFCFLCFVFIQHRDKQNKNKTQKTNRQQSWMDNIEYTGHNTETKKIKIKHRKQNRQSWMDNFCVSFLFCLSPCCVLYT